MERSSILTDRRIPKVIHYCWFGGNPKSELILKCLSSWQRFCPDYEIIEWNENNWDIHQYSYTEEAYAAKKWAFVSDVARLDILYTYGGIYLDTDVELKSHDPFSSLLFRDAFFSFENERAINTGMCCGTQASNPLYKALLQPYRDRHFNANRLKSEINTVINKPVFRSELGIEWNDKPQIIENIEILTTGQFNTFAIHYGSRTWDPEQTKYTLSRKLYKKTALKRWLRDPDKFKHIEEKFGEGLILNAYTFLAYDLLENGLFYFVKRIFKKAVNFLSRK